MRGRPRASYSHNRSKEEVMFSHRAQLPLGSRPYRAGWPGCAMDQGGGPSLPETSSDRPRPQFAHLFSLAHSARIALDTKEVVS